MDAKTLDAARWAEACRLVVGYDDAPSRRRTHTYRRLVVEDWQPPEPVDELEEAYKVALLRFNSNPERDTQDFLPALRAELASRGLVIGKPVRMTGADLDREAQTVRRRMRWVLEDGVRAGFLLAGGHIEEPGDEG